MGIRMTIKDLDTEKIYGDDHKLYGYEKYEDVKNSVDTLLSYAKTQLVWEGDEDRDNEDTYYTYMCIGIAFGPVVLSADKFKEFAKAYREDFHRLKEHSDYFEEYMEELINSPGEKELLWC